MVLLGRPCFGPDLPVTSPPPRAPLLARLSLIPPWASWAMNLPGPFVGFSRHFYAPRSTLETCKRHLHTYKPRHTHIHTYVCSGAWRRGTTAYLQGAYIHPGSVGADRYHSKCRSLTQQQPVYYSNCPLLVMLSHGVKTPCFPTSNHAPYSDITPISYILHTSHISLFTPHN